MCVLSKRPPCEIGLRLQISDQRFCATSALISAASPEKMDGNTKLRAKIRQKYGLQKAFILLLMKQLNFFRIPGSIT